MKADQSLINMAKQVAESKGYNDIGAIIEKNLQSWADTVETRIKARESEKLKRDEEIVSYLENMPVAQMEKVPDNLKQQTIDLAKGWQNEYADVSRDLPNYDKSSIEYSDGVIERNKISKKFESLNTSFLSLAKFKEDEIAFADSGKYSNAMSVEERKFRNAIVTGTAESRITDDAVLEFKNPTTGEFRSLESLGKRVAINEQFGKDMLNLLSKSRLNKLAPTAENRDLIKAQVSLSLGKNADEIRAAAADNPFTGEDLLGLTDEQLNDPENLNTIRETLVDFYTDLMIKGEEAAYDAVQETAEDKLKLRNKYTTKNNNGQSFDEWLLKNSVNNPTNTTGETSPPPVDDGLKTSFMGSLDTEVKTKMGNDVNSLTEDELKAIKKAVLVFSTKNNLTPSEGLALVPQALADKIFD